MLRRLFKVPILLIAVAVFALVGVLGKMAFRSVYDAGHQAGADSVATAVDSARVATFTKVKDSLLAARATLAKRDSDSTRTLQRDVSALNKRVAELHRTPVPTVALSSVVDSQGRAPSVAVTIEGDTARYLVHQNIGHWIEVANIKLAQDDSIIGEQGFALNVRYPALLALRDGELRIDEQAIVSYDSIVTNRNDENARLRRIVARLTPGRIDKLERLSLYALAGYGAYQGARRLARS